MRRLLTTGLLLAAGCRNCADQVPGLVEQQVAAVAHARADSAVVPCAAADPPAEGPPDLASLWDLTLANNPMLREAAAEVEAAQGRLIQAGTYPNPHIVANDEEWASNKNKRGNPSIEIGQEIVTGGKRRLDLAVAGRDLDAHTVALLGRKFEILTRVRRAYFDYLALRYAVQVSRQVVSSLEEGVEITRKLVEQAKTRPRTDLLRLQALLEEARITLARAQTNLDSAWRQLAADIGLPHLSQPSTAPALPNDAPLWESELVAQRVQSTNTELRQAELEAERARISFERARAEAVPNVTVSGGYIRSYIDELGGGILRIETALPVWDRKQGRIHEARALWAQAQAAQRSTSTRLSRDTAEAFARYAGARLQADRLARSVIPQLEESLKLVREGYQAGAAGIGFADVLLAVEALNDARLRLVEARRELWRAVADLEGLMQLDLGQDLADALPAPCPVP
jgi:cobalt-zinc-cadmium efflux system outer membrane protein